jgi:hypothetical protein
VDIGFIKPLLPKATTGCNVESIGQRKALFFRRPRSLIIECDLKQLHGQGPGFHCQVNE